MLLRKEGHVTKNKCKKELLQIWWPGMLEMIPELRLEG